jgi:hypothetical protein
MKYQAEKENGVSNHSNKSLKNKANISIDDSFNTEATNDSKVIFFSHYFLNF